MESEERRRSSRSLLTLGLLCLLGAPAAAFLQTYGMPRTVAGSESALASYEAKRETFLTDLNVGYGGRCELLALASDLRKRGDDAAANDLLRFGAIGLRIPAAAAGLAVACRDGKGFHPNMVWARRWAKLALDLCALRQPMGEPFGRKDAFRLLASLQEQVP